MLEDSFSELEKGRLEKLEAMRAEGLEPFPTRSEQTHTSLEAIKAFEKAEAAGDETSVDVKKHLRKPKLPVMKPLRM